MLQTIVIGIAGRPEDAEALALARRLASPQAELIAAHVSVLDAIGMRLAAVDVATGADPEGETIVDAFIEARPELEGSVVRASSVGTGLARLARGARADLIVLASSRRGLLGRTFAGDAVRDVLRHAPCPVAIAPVGYAAQGPLGELVVGYDGSPEADTAVATAVNLAGRDGGRVGVVEVVETYAAASGVASFDGQLIAEGYDRAKRDLDRLATEYGLHGAITTGRAAHELARASSTADLLCIGLHEHGILDRLMVGSTAHALLREQSAPLLIVPPQVAADGSSHAVADALDEERSAAQAAPH